MAAGVSLVDVESLVITVAAAPYPGPKAGNCTESTIPGYTDHRGGKGDRDRRDEYRASVVPGRVGVNRRGGPLTRRRHLQRGFHGDRGEPEHTAVRTATR
jgi:hypothetical protein